MKISVAMATYNGEKYIEEQLTSILRQTVPVDEVIICDDRSSDQTAFRIQSFISRNALEHNWKFISNGQNLGYASNFIKALRLTSGDLVFFCDQDDIWISDRIEKIKAVMETHSEVLLLGSEFEPFSSTADAPRPHRWELKKFRRDDSLEKMEFCSENIFIGCQGCTMCMRRSFIDTVNPYWYSGWAHDEYVWKLALCMEGLYFYHAVTLKRRLHSNNVTLHREHEKGQRIKYLEELLKSHQKTLEFLEDQGLEKGKAELLKRHIRATEMRISLIENHRYLNMPLLMMKYSDCYHKRRAIPVELMIAVRGK